MLMRIATLVFVCSVLSGALFASELVIHFEEKGEDVLASTRKNIYLLESGKSNPDFLMKDVRREDGSIQPAGRIRAIFSSGVSFKNYFRVLSYLNRIGYTDLEVFIESDDGESMRQFEIKSIGENQGVPDGATHSDKDQ